MTNSKYSFGTEKGNTRRKSASENRIIGGQDAEENQFPWQAYLEITKTSVVSICGGSLVSDHHVITAAHCVENWQR